MEAIRTNLVIAGLNTLEPKIYWNGELLPNVVDIATNWDNEEPKVKIRVSADSNVAILMRASGIRIKVGGTK